MALSEFAGKYKLVKSVNFDDFMCALGVGFFLRKMGNQLSPELTVEIDGDHYKFSSVTTFKSSVLEFDIGKEFQTKTPDDRNVKSIVNVEGNKLIQKEYPVEEGAGEEKNTTYIRELDENKDLIVTCKIGQIECVRTYKRLDQ